MHHFNNKAITDVKVAPAIIYSNEEIAIGNVLEETEGPQDQELIQEEPVQSESTSETPHELVNQVEQMEDLTKSVILSKLNSNDFFQSRILT